MTRSEGPKVIQLDGRPAQDVYFERLGVDGADLGESEFNALSMVHPLAEPELSGAVRPRYVRAHTADGGSSRDDHRAQRRRRDLRPDARDHRP